MHFLKIRIDFNMKVQKCGRTTGQTEGRVSYLNVTVNVNYGVGVATFYNQIGIRPGGFSAGGDSGSLIVVKGGNNDRRPVGLLYAGSSSLTIANPIIPILARFGVTIDGE
ncbi:MAG: hypothetical protein E2O67_01585 [Deltaproteobacteria bacterium]|nr:MAG: hypothetical protein E2O67_01585 [Deltaproteobacteria bacterium]